MFRSIQLNTLPPAMTRRMPLLRRAAIELLTAVVTFVSVLTAAPTAIPAPQLQ
jgi:hypothetical protein